MQDDPFTIRGEGVCLFAGFGGDLDCCLFGLAHAHEAFEHVNFGESWGYY